MGRVRHINIPVFIPHMGCPHACIFCNQKRISGSFSTQTPENVRRLLEESFSTVNDEDHVEIAFFGGSFTGIPEVEMISYLEEARPYIGNGRAKGIRLSTRPDAIDRHILSILKDYGVTVIELGVQSLDPDVLSMSQRGHSTEDVVTACALIKEYGISLGIQTMLGLPGDSLEKSIETAREVIELRPDMVRIYPALVLKGTQMEDYYRNGSYKPLELEEAVEWCARILPLYREAGITVLRIGLQGSESLEDSIVAGPYHPAFGELAESRILLKKMTDKLDRMEADGKHGLIIRTLPELVSKIVGQNRSNIRKLKEKYGFKKIDVLTGPDYGEFSFEIINE
ncbi:MAG TPA: radical SAM protein [Clostridiaceae bacterium]|nr:radical SAM protein [Clostridiaceae bacterium]